MGAFPHMGQHVSIDDCVAATESRSAWPNCTRGRIVSHYVLHDCFWVAGVLDSSPQWDRTSLVPCRRHALATLGHRALLLSRSIFLCCLPLCSLVFPFCFFTLPISVYVYLSLLSFLSFSLASLCSLSCHCTPPVVVSYLCLLFSSSSPLLCSSCLSGCHGFSLVLSLFLVSHCSHFSPFSLLSLFCSTCHSVRRVWLGNGSISSKGRVRWVW